MIPTQRHVCQPEADPMHVWTVSEPGVAADAAQAALLGMIPHLGSPGFRRQALAAINLGLPSGSWSVYRIRRNAPPVCYLSESHERPDTTADCLQVYRTWLYRHDRTFEALADGAGDRVKALHLTAADVPDPRHRHAIYERHGLRERLSVASTFPDASILSVNLYRHADQPGFGDRELDLFSHLAPGLFALVARQIELCAPSPAHAGMSREACRTLLLQLDGAMPPRELDVCERLLAGMSHDGIACDLGIAPSTVKTYRNRAFDRLGIHHNNALFALALRQARPD